MDELSRRRQSRYTDFFESLDKCGTNSIQANPYIKDLNKGIKLNQQEQKHSVVKKGFSFTPLNLKKTKQVTENKSDPFEHFDYQQSPLEDQIILKHLEVHIRAKHMRRQQEARLLKRVKQKDKMKFQSQEENKEFIRISSNTSNSSLQISLQNPLRQKKIATQLSQSFSKETQDKRIDHSIEDFQIKLKSVEPQSYETTSSCESMDMIGEETMPSPARLKEEIQKSNQASGEIPFQIMNPSQQNFLKKKFLNEMDMKNKITRNFMVSNQGHIKKSELSQRIKPFTDISYCPDVIQKNLKQSIEERKGHKFRDQSPKSNRELKSPLTQSFEFVDKSKDEFKGNFTSIKNGPQNFNAKKSVNMRFSLGAVNEKLIASTKKTENKNNYQLFAKQDKTNVQNKYGNQSDGPVGKFISQKSEESVPKNDSESSENSDKISETIEVFQQTTDLNLRTSVMTEEQQIKQNGRNFNILKCKKVSNLELTSGEYGLISSSSLAVNENQFEIAQTVRRKCENVHPKKLSKAFGTMQLTNQSKYAAKIPERIESIKEKINLLITPKRQFEKESTHKRTSPIPTIHPKKTGVQKSSLRKSSTAVHIFGSSPEIPKEKSETQLAEPVPVSKAIPPNLVYNTLNQQNNNHQATQFNNSVGILKQYFTKKESESPNSPDKIVADEASWESAFANNTSVFNAQLPTFLSPGKSRTTICDSIKVNQGMKSLTQLQQNERKLFSPAKNLTESSPTRGIKLRLEGQNIAQQQRSFVELNKPMTVVQPVRVSDVNPGKITLTKPNGFSSVQSTQTSVIQTVGINLRSDSPLSFKLAQMKKLNTSFQQVTQSDSSNPYSQIKETKDSCQCQIIEQPNTVKQGPKKIFVQNKDLAVTSPVLQVSKQTPKDSIFKLIPQPLEIQDYHDIQVSQVQNFQSLTTAKKRNMVTRMLSDKKLTSIDASKRNDIKLDLKMVKSRPLSPQFKNKGHIQLSDAKNDNTQYSHFCFSPQPITTANQGFTMAVKRSAIGQQRNSNLQKSVLKDFSFQTYGSQKTTKDQKNQGVVVKDKDKATGKPHKRIVSQTQVSSLKK